jgi:hypothetical protein
MLEPVPRLLRWLIGPARAPRRPQQVSSPAYARARAALLSETGPFAAWAVNGREYESFGDDGEPQGAAH